MSPSTCSWENGQILMEKNISNIQAVRCVVPVCGEKRFFSFAKFQILMQPDCLWENNCSLAILFCPKNVCTLTQGSVTAKAIYESRSILSQSSSGRFFLFVFEGCFVNILFAETVGGSYFMSKADATCSLMFHPAILLKMKTSSPSSKQT